MKAILSTCRYPTSLQGWKASLITIAFRPGDATGDTSTYREWEIVVPREFQFSENPTRVYPRVKVQADWSPLPIEWAIPLFVTRTHQIIPYSSTLLELWVTWQNTLWVIWRMNGLWKPTIVLTVAGEWEKRHGDPHAIFSPQESWASNSYQVVWFLSATDPRSKVFELLNSEWRIPPNE